MSELITWLDKAVSKEHSSYMTMRRRIELNNGITLSIQASYGHYCDPRVNTDESGSGIYDSVEIGYPSKEIPLLSEYAEDPDDLIKTVYPRVPVSVLEKVVEWAGGIKGLQEK